MKPYFLYQSSSYLSLPLSQVLCIFQISFIYVSQRENILTATALVLSDRIHHALADILTLVFV